MAEMAATFKNSWGRKHILHIEDANTELAPEQIRASLEKLTTISLFKNKGARLFDKVVTASFIEEVETILFDNATEETFQEITEFEESNEAEVCLPITEQEESLMNTTEELQVAILEEERIQPDVLKQVIELPLGINLSDLTQDQALSLVASVMPKGGVLKDIKLDEEVIPARIELFVQLKGTDKRNQEIEERSNSSPPRDTRKGWRLFDRLTKRRRRR